LVWLIAQIHVRARSSNCVRSQAVDVIVRHLDHLEAIVIDRDLVPLEGQFQRVRIRAHAGQDQTVGLISSVNQLPGTGANIANSGGHAVFTTVNTSATANTSVYSGVISGDLDEAFVSIPTVAADGRIYVAFLNTTNLQNGRDDYEVVEVSPATGARVFGPVKVATVIDGNTDYPLALGRQTYHDSLFRSWAAGNITADPTNAAHLAVVWSDMRNSTLPAPRNPYTAVTNSDVIVSQSFDRGRTWSAPVALTRTGDQFQPWGAYDKTGFLRIGLFDRFYDPLNHQYGYSLATETGMGALTFTTTQLTTALSEPTKDNRWFATTLNPTFPFATTFIGDFSNIAARPSGGIVAYWTDLRLQACFGTRCGHGQDAFFAAAP